MKAVWDLEAAYRETTPTRERICINGLWRWQPAGGSREHGAGRRLGLLQGPRVLAGNHRLHAEGLPDGLCPSELEGREAGRRATAAWYQREITRAQRVGRPAHRPAALEYLNSFAAVYVDGKKAGEMQFPAGEVDLTSAVPPGRASTCSACSSSAMPLKGVMLSFSDTDAAQQVQGRGGAARAVRRRLSRGHARGPRGSPT